MQHRGSTTEQARHRLSQIELEIAEILRNYPELAGQRPERFPRTRLPQVPEADRVFRRLPPH